MTEAGRVEQEAADWLARFDASGAAGDDMIAAFSEIDEDFANWVNDTTAHRVAFLRLARVWARADRMAALTPAAPGRQNYIRKLRIAVASSAIAASVAVAVYFSFAGFGSNGAPQVYETAVGGRETAPLADGSRIELNTDTRLVATITKTGRGVVLEKGEAYFDIAHDETRPFIIDAGDKKITVVGTKFSVRRAADEVEVIVEEGKVRIEDEAPASVLEPTLAVQGTQMIARAGGALMRSQTPAELAAEFSWRRGLLIFDQMELESVAAEFNRYNRVKIVVADPKIADLRIGGSFRAENVDTFVRLLKDGFGLRVERRGDQFFIFS